jgi:hypothetical protein
MQGKSQLHVKNERRQQCMVERNKSVTSSDSTELSSESIAVKNLKIDRYERNCTSNSKLVLLSPESRSFSRKIPLEGLMTTGVYGQC